MQVSESQIDKLESWKEIAGFIDRDVRTAIRWAKDQGMPVHRIPGGKRGRVYGSRSEIERWLQGRQEETPAPPPAPQSSSRKSLRWGLIAAAIIVVLAAVVASLAFLRPGPSLARVGFRDNTVYALGPDDQEIWTHEYPRRIDPGLLPTDATLDEFVRIVDLFGDGHRELILVAPYRLGPNPGDSFRAEVDCFSEHGRLLWSYLPDQAFRFGTHDIDGAWMIFDVFVSKGQPNPRIWVSVGHSLWGNSFVAEIDPRTGHADLRFVNTGIIYTLNEMADGNKSYLLAGGFNNEHDSGILAILDEQTSFAVSPQTEGTRHYCDSCPKGAPDYYFVFPRSEINRLEGVYEDPVRRLDVHGHEVQLRKYELQHRPNTFTDYLVRFDATVEPVSIRYDSGYDMLHRTLTAQGKLDHPLDRCPERLHPHEVRMWTPAAGWSLIRFPTASAAQ